MLQKPELYKIIFAQVVILKRIRLLQQRFAPLILSKLNWDILFTRSTVIQVSEGCGTISLQWMDYLSS